MAEDYVVGPGRPPKEYRFKPGQSGNPKGAKRKPPSLVPDLKKIFQRALNQKIECPFLIRIIWPALTQMTSAASSTSLCTK
jgi:hypothetical protein